MLIAEQTANHASVAIVLIASVGMPIAFVILMWIGAHFSARNDESE